MRQRGSVLIASVWTLSVLFLLSTSLAFYASVFVRSARERTELFVSGTVFASSVPWMARLFSEDVSAVNDAPGEAWLGTVTVPERWRRDLWIESRDEESKLNLNSAPGPVLQELFASLKRQQVFLADESETARAIVEYRAHKPFEHLEELALVGLDAEAREKLKPFVTVYAAKGLAPRVNLNTAPPPVLEAMTRTLPETAGPVRETILSALRRAREAGVVFTAEDLAPDRFASKLGLPRNPETDAAVATLAAEFTTDSALIRVEMTYRKRRFAEAVLEPTRDETRVLFWRERKVALHAA